MLFNEQGYDQFLDMAGQIGRTVQGDLERGILCDALILAECYEKAKNSITFHGENLSGSEFFSHLREAGHLCFWLSRLKPLSFKLRARELAGIFIKGSSFAMMRPDLDRDAEEYKINLTFPLNEYFAFLFAHTIAMTALNSLEQKSLSQGKTDEGASIKRWAQECQSKFDDISAKIVHSLRTNNHSARSMALMFEWAYSGSEVCK